MNLSLENKTFFLTGVANKKSVATFIGKSLLEAGAKIILSVQGQDQLEQAQKLFPDSKVIMLDVTNDEELKSLKDKIKAYTTELHGFIHCIAYAHFDESNAKFHQVGWNDFSYAIKTSCYSLISISHALKSLFSEDASVVSISISNTKATSYGYLGPIKAMLEHSICYLAKSFSEHSNVRFNAIGAGPLKTSASAGIPNYIQNYLYAEALTLRKSALKTEEVSNTALFLLSPMSSGINATTICVDAGMNVNYFDQDVVNKFAK